jgi:hypothetical protein
MFRCTFCMKKREETDENYPIYYKDGLNEGKPPIARYCSQICLHKGLKKRSLQRTVLRLNKESNK